MKLMDFKSELTDILRSMGDTGYHLDVGDPAQNPKRKQIKLDIKLSGVKEPHVNTLCVKASH